MKKHPKRSILKQVARGNVSLQGFRREHQQPDLSQLSVTELRLLKRYAENRDGTKPHHFTDEELLEIESISKKINWQ